MKPSLQLLGGVYPEGLNSRYQALLAYLALSYPKPIVRAELAFKLWPDSSEEQALTNLRKALYHFKQMFADEEVIRADARTLQLDTSLGVQLDIVEFNSALDSATRTRQAGDSISEQTSLEAAIRIYRGDLLPHLYDEWLIVERESLRDRFIHAVDRLIALLEARQHYRDAIQYAERLLRMDNLREETYRTLIRLHALNHDRAAALNIYHVCASTLSKELGVEPDASTREAYERLLKSDSQILKVSISARPLSYPLVAREAEWKSLLNEWKKSSAGELRITFLSGEAGIGKTRLAEDVLHWASRQGIHTASATCYSAEGQISFAPVTSWLRSMPMERLDAHWQSELARILPELRRESIAPQPLTENWQRQIFFEAMARGLLLQNEPLLLFLDDIQWCDRDTLEWLSYFMRFDKTAMVLILATLRAEELSSHPILQSLLVDLRAANQSNEIQLNRLDKRQTAILGTHLLGRDLSEVDSNLLFRESEGVPLFIVELAQAGISGVSVGEAELGSGEKAAQALPPRLKAVLEGRLARLSSPARAVIESAAVIGREFDFKLLRNVSELDEAATMHALDELWRKHMVRERGGVYDFSHDKLREVTLADISPVRLHWLHQRAAEALEQDGLAETYARIADHFERAGLSIKASEYYARAATQAGQLFAFAEALNHLHHALLLEARHAFLANLHEQRGDVLTILGRSDDAFQAFEVALGLAGGPLQRARLARKQLSLVSRHAVETAAQKYQRALNEIGLAEKDANYWHEWIDIQFAWVLALYWKLDSNAMDVLLAQTQSLVEQYGTPVQKIHQVHRMLNSAFVREHGRIDEHYLSMARENIARAIALADSHLISTTQRTFGMAAFFVEHFEACAAAFQAVIELSEKNGDINSLLIARVYMSLAHRRLKNIEAVRADTQALLALLPTLGRNPEYKGIAESNLAWLAYLPGNREAALQHAQTAHEIWKAQATVYSVQWGALIILFALAVEAQNWDAARAYARAMLDPLQLRLRQEVESALQSTLEADPADEKLFSRQCSEAVEQATAAGYL